MILVPIFSLFQKKSEKELFAHAFESYTRSCLYNFTKNVLNERISFVSFHHKVDWFYCLQLLPAILSFGCELNQTYSKLVKISSLMKFEIKQEIFIEPLCIYQTDNGWNNYETHFMIALKVADWVVLCKNMNRFLA